MTVQTVEVKIENLPTHISAPFYGKNVDENGNALPSKREKSWTFTLSNSRLNTHMTFKSVRPKGHYLTDPTTLYVMDGNDVYEKIGTVGKSGALNASYVVGSSRLSLAQDTLKWLLSANQEDMESSPHLKIFAQSRCARCARKLTNPNSIEFFFGPICRGKANISKPAQPKAKK